MAAQRSNASQANRRKCGDLIGSERYKNMLVSRHEENELMDYTQWPLVLLTRIPNDSTKLKLTHVALLEAKNQHWDNQRFETHRKEGNPIIPTEAI